MTIKELSEKGLARGNRWHKGGITDWNPLEWAGAMAGEAGEACNAAKKLKRLTDEIPSINEGDRHFTSLDEANYQTAKEAADTIIYAVMLIIRVGYIPETVLREVFNKKSEEYGFPERL